MRTLPTHLSLEILRKCLESSSVACRSETCLPVRHDILMALLRKQSRQRTRENASHKTVPVIVSQVFTAILEEAARPDIIIRLATV